MKKIVNKKIFKCIKKYFIETTKSCYKKIKQEKNFANFVN